MTKLCVKHGGKESDFDQRDAYFMCDTCTHEGIEPCKCGSRASKFGEALMSAVSCDTCKESVYMVGYASELQKKLGYANIVDAWNNGVRGEIKF